MPIDRYGAGIYGLTPIIISAFPLHFPLTLSPHPFMNRLIACILAGILILPGLLPAQDCEVSPFDILFLVGKMADDFGADLFPIEEEQEMKIGQQFHSEASGSLRMLSDDPRLLQLRSILAKLVPYRERKGISYQIYLFDDEMVNAFSHAGGHIYVSTGLMNFVQSEGELAFVIGHEISHVDKRHCIRPVQKMIAAGQIANDVGVIAAQVQQFLATPFGQTNEYESDWAGATLVSKAGYNPRQGKDFFRKLQQKENPNLLEKMTRTHPFSAERECYLEHFISTEID